jgi:hypothetical protein
MQTVATVLAVVLAVHILIKFAFFALPYSRRRAALDRAYGRRLSATATSDVVSLVAVALLTLILFVAGVHAVSFLIGLWIGATLVQLYFHRFHEPPPPSQTPRPPIGPIKLMSYAIQATPWRPWPEIGALTILVVISLIALATG